MADGDDVRIICEGFVCYGVDVLVVIFGAAREVELDEIVRRQRLAVDGVLVGVFVEPGADDFDVEDCAAGGADGVGEGLERGGAVVEGEAAEGE